MDGIRYLLIREVPLGNDAEFSHEGLVARYNADLANNFGNLMARVSTVVAKKCGGVIGAPRSDSPLRAPAEQAVADNVIGWTEIRPADVVDATWRLIRETNAFLESNEPWKAEPGPAVDGVMADAVEACRIVVLLTNPIMPTTCQIAWERLGLDGRIDDQRLPDAAVWGAAPAGRTIVKGDPLFPRKAVPSASSPAGATGANASPHVG